MIQPLLSAAALAACTLATGTLAAAQDIPEGLVHHFTFSDRDHPGLDSVTGGAVLTGSTAWYAERDRFGAFPNARTLDRAGFLQNRQRGFTRLAHVDFTLSYWLRVFRFVDTTEALYLFDNRTDGSGTGLFARYLPEAEMIEYGEEGALQTASAALDTVAWVHLAFVEDTTAGTRTLYLNGEALPLSGAAYRPVTGTAGEHPTFRILGTTAGSIPRSGAIRYVDDVRLHDRAVRPQTVAAMYAERDTVAPAPTRGPVAFNPPSANGFVQTRWAEADDDHLVREYVVTLNDSTWSTQYSTPFFNYRYEDGEAYTLRFRSVDYFGNESPTTYDTTFVWGTSSAAGAPAWAGALSVAPNPVRAGGTVTLTGLPNEPVHIELLSTTGQVTGGVQREGDALSLPAALSAGVYVLRLRDGAGGVGARRIIVE